MNKREKKWRSEEREGEKRKEGGGEGIKVG
jgi:hypothetical protein